MRRQTLYSIASVLFLASPGWTQTLSQVLTQLDTRVSPSDWMDPYTGKGVLHDQGWALWEMPRSYPIGGSMIAMVDGGGYNHAVRRLALDASFYSSLILPAFTCALYNAQDLAGAESIYFSQTYGQLNPSDFSGVYDAGTSIALQNLVFAPIKTVAGPYTFYSYPELGWISSVATGLSLYGNIGFQNNGNFYGNEWQYNIEHGQKGKVPHYAWGTGFSRPANVAPETVLLKRDPPDGTVQPRNCPSFGVITPEYWMAPLDVADPAVITDCLASIEQMANTWGSSVKFFVGGEYGVGIDPPGPTACGASCPPLTDYSARSMAAFHVHLARKYLTIGALNTAWNLNPTLTQFNQVTPSHIVPDASSNHAAIGDFKTFLNTLKLELDLLQYKTAKVKKKDGSYGILTFGTLGMEFGWLGSDFAATGNWYGSAADYFGSFGHYLYHYTNASGLSGTPASMAITSPATDERGCTIYQTLPAPFLQRCISQDHVRLFMHDVLTAGSFHIGYYKTPGEYTTYQTDSATAIITELQALKAARTTKLRFMTPYRRVHMHLDSAKLHELGASYSASNVVAFLEREQYPYSLFSDGRSFKRLFAKNLATRGAVVSPFHSDLLANNAALFQSYRTLANTTNPQPTIGVMVDNATGNALFSGGHLSGMVPIGTIGSGWVLQDPANLFFVVAYPTNTPPVADMEAMLQLLLHLTPSIPTQPFVVSPALPTGTRVHTNFVTDGLNYYVALSNRDQTQSVTGLALQLHSEVTNKFGPTVSSFVPDVAGPYNLAPRETKLIYFKAVIPGSYTTTDLGNELLQIQTNLAALNGQNFEVGAGVELHAFATAIDPNLYPERVIAGIMRLRKMIFMKATRTGASIAIEVARQDGTPVANAPLQILHLIDGHEEQDAGVTDGLGKATVTIGAMSKERWDFLANPPAYAVPPATPATDAVEVHVNDRALGAHSFVIR